MSKSRKQKKRTVQEATTAIRHMTANFMTIVDSVFTYAEWVFMMTPENTTTESMALVRWFIAHSLVYCNIFRGKDADGKAVLYIDKDVLTKTILTSEQVENYSYSGTFTKELGIEIMNVCLDKFFNNTIFPVIDKKTEEPSK